MIRLFVGILVSLFFLGAHAEKATKPLPPSEAFQLTAKYIQPGLLTLQWKMAPTYYLYQDKIVIHTGANNTVLTGDIVLPKGIEKKDTLHGAFQAYKDQVAVLVPIKNERNGILNLLIEYQGCSENGFCYPLINKQLKVNLAEVTPPADLTIQSIRKIKSAQDEAPSKQAKIEGLFNGHSLFFIIASFMGLGLLLSFTPCVLPMIPILSGIIVGHGKHLGWRKTFLLSLTYVLGMAITYSIAGIVVALLGSNLQVQFQRTWVIVLFSGVFVLLGLSLFGLYELRLPNSWQRVLTTWSHRQKGGSYFSVFIMGSISSLIVSPCVTAPLIGVLSYIADSGDIGLGGLALFALGLGMGIPLLLVGISAGHILPKAGAWMGVLEKLMGLTMFALAIWILSRVIPGYITLLLWAILFIMTAVFMGAFNTARNDFDNLCRGLGLILFIYGIILMIGGALGNSDLLRPWENWKVISSEKKVLTKTFIVLKNMAELDNVLEKAKSDKKRVLLDFYADWCETCIRMDKSVFDKDSVKAALAEWVLIRADVTVNNNFSQALLKRFHVVAPPTILLFNREGYEQINDRLIGETSAIELLDQIKKIRDDSPKE